MTDQGPGWGARPPQGPQGPMGPPGPAPPPPPGYPYQYPGGYAPRQTDGKAIAALVLAICSLVLMPLLATFTAILAIIALVLASSSRKQIAESGGRLTGESLNKVAVILAWVSIGLAILVTVVITIVIIVAVNADNALAFVRY